MSILNLFPTPVGIYSLGRKLTEEETNTLICQEIRQNSGNLTSKNSYILQHDDLQDLKVFFETSVKTYFKETINPSKDVKLNITQSWVNYTKSQQHHHKHRHPNSVISGVFYIQTDASKDRIYFYNYIQYNQIAFEVTEWNVYNSKSWWVEATPNTLLLFPSSLEHMVETLDSDRTEDRISLSFNTFPTGMVGSEIELTQLYV